MAYYVVPGIKLPEIDLSEYSPALSTSTLGIVGTATKGPINEATFISSAEQFIEIFGQPTPDSYMAYAALEFLKRGKAMWVIRVCGGSSDGSPYTSALKASIAVTGAASYATILGANSEYFTITAATGPTHTGTEVESFIIEEGVNDGIKITGTGISGDIVTGATIDPDTYTATGLAFAISQSGHGYDCVDDGNGKIKITGTTTGSTSTLVVEAVAKDMYTTIGWTAATYTGTDGTDDLQVSDEAETKTFTLTAGSRSASQIADDINNDPDPASNFVASADSLGRVKLIKDATGVDKTLQVLAASTADTPLGFDNTIHAGSSAGTATTLTLYAKTEGTWANNYYATISTGTTVSNSFKLDLYNSNGLRLETFDNMVKDSSSANFHETIIENGSEYITSTDAAAISSLPVNGNYTLDRGVNGIDDITSADYIGTVTVTGVKTGLQIFSNPNDIPINILIVPGATEETVQNELISICEVKRGDSIAILDTPYGLTVQGVVNFMNGEGDAYSARSSLNSSYACLYWPWIKIYDPYNPTAGDDSDGYIWQPDSGFVAAAMVYTDYIADPWFPPAGPQRGRLISAQGIEYNSEDGDIELMYAYPNNLNAIIEKDNIIQIYGQKTLQRTASSKDRIGTRRMLLYAEKIVAKSLSVLLWEPNDEITWRRFERLVTPIFETIKNRRGLYEFKVQCDSDTNTDALISQNIVSGKILMQHMKYAEIIEVKFVSTPTGVEFSEVA